MSKKAKRILALLQDPRHKTKLLDKINRDTAPEGYPVSGMGGGGGQEMTVLKDMNEMDEAHDAFMDSFKATGET